MARSIGTAGTDRFLPNGAVDFFRRRLREGLGVCLAVGAVSLLLALFSYVPSDPSLNHATDGTVSNLLGLGGAYVADFLLQGFGLLSGLPALVLAAWGWKLFFRHDTSRLNATMSWMRLILLPMAMILLAIGLSAMATPKVWPLMTGLGGVVGSVLSEHFDKWINISGLDLATWVVPSIASALGMAAIITALGITWQEWLQAAKGLGRGAMMLGRLCKWAGHNMVSRQAEEPAGKTGRMSTTKSMAKSAAARSPRRSGLVATAAGKAKTGSRGRAKRQGTLDLVPDGQYKLPPLEILDLQPDNASVKISHSVLEENARALESVLRDFGVHGEIIKVRPGPVVALYELKPAPGTKTSRVIGLSDDIARSMSAVSVRIAVVPGQNVIGIELPNINREMVYLRELLASERSGSSSGKLNLALGKDIGGSPVLVDLARMPHLLIAGTTGSGKSVAINTMILSLLYQLSPDTCKFIMIDPKMLELSVYEGIPHLLAPVVTDPAKAITALKWTVREMEERYRAMSQLGVRNIEGYNARLKKARDKDETLTRRVQTGFDDDGKPVFEEQPLSMEELPFIVVVVDEMADLMLVAGKDIEAAVQRLAQMARAAGIHLIMATQRPSVDVITGTIKANFPTRVSFQVTSKIDSRTILGEQGAEQLLGQGDMLYMAGGGRILRVHGPFVSDSEVESVVKYLRFQGPPNYKEEVTEEADDASLSPSGGGSGCDDLYDEAVALIAREGKASTSFIQRHLQIGYNRAARIIEYMEKDGIISKANRVGRREVLIGSEETI